jgi:hypothetical protein
MMDAVVPGGVAGDVSLSLRDEQRRQCDDVEREVRGCATSTTNTPACRTASWAPAVSCPNWPRAWA